MNGQFLHCPRKKGIAAKQLLLPQSLFAAFPACVDAYPFCAGMKKEDFF